MCTGFVQSYGSLIAVRLILGALEAGLFPGLNVYLTFFYTKRELALRVGYLFVSAAVAGALGGLLAYGLGHMGGLAGLAGWRWIMIIEGLPSILLGVAALFLLPNDPQHAWFLSDAEKRLMSARFRRHYGDTASAQEFSRHDMLAAFRDWKVWAFCIAQFGADTMLYGEPCLLISRPLVTPTPIATRGGGGRGCFNFGLCVLTIMRPDRLLHIPAHHYQGAG